MRKKVNIANEVAEQLYKIRYSDKKLLHFRMMNILQELMRKNYDIMIGEIEVSANNDLTPLVSSTDNYFSYANPTLICLSVSLE